MEKHGGKLPVRIKAVPEGTVLPLQELLHDRREHRSQVFLAGHFFGDSSGSSLVSHDGGVQLQRAEESHFEVFFEMFAGKTPRIRIIRTMQ